MRLLAFDTATTGCSAAVIEDGRVLARRAEDMARGQSEALMPMIAEVLDDAGCGFDGLDALAVTTGPGAFTGLRIGLAAARGLALALRLPCAGVTTLEAVAQAQPEAERAGAGAVLVVLDSKRADVYAQVFAPDLSPITEPAALMIEDLPRLCGDRAPVLVAGDAADRALAVLADGGIAARAAGGPGVPDAAQVGLIASARALPPAGRPPGPVYLRPPDAVAPKNGGRLRP